MITFIVDTIHCDTTRYDTKHNSIECHLRIVTFYCYTDCHYAECRGADYSCRQLTSNIKWQHLYNYCTINYDKKSFIILTPWLQWDHDTQHNDTKHIGLICDTQHNNIERHYADCHYADCRGADYSCRRLANNTKWH